MHFLIYSNSLQEVNTKRLKKQNKKFTLQYVQFMTSYEEIKFLIKMANYITKQIALKLAVNPRILTMNGNVPAFQHSETLDYSWL